MAQAEDIIKNILHNVAKEEKLDTYDIEIKPMTTEGANFLSKIYKVIISSPTRADQNLFAKVATLPQAYRDKVPIQLIYETEITAYTNILSAYELLQEKYEVPKEDRYKFPKYYASSLANNEEIIILEDLTAQGYTMYDRFKTINWEYASKGVEELAKLHALSIVFKKEYPEDYARDTKQDEQTQLLDLTYNMMKEPYTELAKTGINLMPEQYKDQLTKFVQDQWEKDIFLKYYGPSKWGFIVHGDYRASNILFKRQAGQVKFLVPVDYQAIHLGSPCIDLLYFIYCGTDAEFRKLNLKALLDRYYNTLSRFLIKFNLDPVQIFSRKEFDEEFKDKLGYGLCTALSVVPLVLAEGNIGPDAMDAGDTIPQDMVLKPAASFNKRIIPLINEFIKWGVLKK